MDAMKQRTFIEALLADGSALWVGYVVGFISGIVAAAVLVSKGLV